MTTAQCVHRLDGLESDNLLAFLALLGLLRALEAYDRGPGNADPMRPRADWDLATPPLRPRLVLAQAVPRDEVLRRAAEGADLLAPDHVFGDAKDLNQSRDECRGMLSGAAESAALARRGHADLLSALMSDVAIKSEKKEPVVDPTPMCLLFGQGHQHFLDRLGSVPRTPTPPARGRGNAAIAVTAARCLDEAVFEPWHRRDSTFSFRWDPAEDVRYALMAGDPTDAAYKGGTQHGANRLAALGLAVLTLAPETRAGRVRPAIAGGAYDAEGFSFAWPVWREPATLQAIAALLAHPLLRRPGELSHLGVDHALMVRRISVGKFMNFTRARPVD